MENGSARFSFIEKAAKILLPPLLSFGRIPVIRPERDGGKPRGIVEVAPFRIHLPRVTDRHRMRHFLGGDLDRVGTGDDRVGEMIDMIFSRQGEAAQRFARGRLKEPIGLFARRQTLGAMVEPDNGPRAVELDGFHLRRAARDIFAVLVRQPPAGSPP